MKTEPKPRRDFLKNSGKAILAGTLLPNIWVKKSFAAKHSIETGHASHRYRINPEWSQADTEKYPVNDCHEMVQDAKGRLILLTNETKNNILIYDRSGKLLESWGTGYPGGHGLSICDEGSEQFLFITDTNRHQVIKTDLKGREILKIDYPKETGEYEYPRQFVPTETAIHPDTGDIYVADGYGLNFIIQYDAKGKYIRHFGGKEAFNCCHGILIDLRNSSKPSLMITDRGNMQFKRFTLEGQYISTIPTPGSFVCRPVVRGRNVYAAVYRSTSQDYPNSGYITILDENDRVISSPGATAPVYRNGSLEEQRKDRTITALMHPHDVCVDKDENIFVPQWNSKKTYPLMLERI
ncbi:MAG: 6-bladed beta-propeller [Cyclobacteriaceae bacterium]|nr:6-bladed beta-propeller [Cyclobacteriaceae bacterium]